MNVSVSSDAADVRFYRAALHELIEMGVDLARDVCRQAKLAPLADATVMYERVAQAVRRTIALAQRLDTPAAGNATRRMARQRVIREVEDRISLEAERPERADGLRSELYERMDRPELDEELDLRPADEIVADICRDLGIAGMHCGRGWPRRTPADIIALCTRAARPGAAAVWDGRSGGAAVEREDAAAVCLAAKGDAVTACLERVLQRVSRDSGSG